MKMRIISLALAMGMCLSVLPLSASAAGGTYTVTFEPLGTYTREQAIATTLRLFQCA